MRREPMRYISTRGAAPPLRFDQAMLTGLARDWADGLALAAEAIDSGAAKAKLTALAAATTAGIAAT